MINSTHDRLGKDLNFRLFLYGGRSTIEVLTLIEKLVHIPQSVYASYLVKFKESGWYTYPTDPITGYQVAFRMRSPGADMLTFDPKDPLHEGVTNHDYSVVTAQKATVEITLTWDDTFTVFNKTLLASQWMIYALGELRNTPALSGAYYTGLGGGVLYKVENVMPGDSAVFNKVRPYRTGMLGKALSTAVHSAWKRAELEPGT